MITWHSSSAEFVSRVTTSMEREDNEMTADVHVDISDPITTLPAST